MTEQENDFSSQFGYLMELINTSKTKDDLMHTFNRFLTHDSTLKNEDNKILSNQIIQFLNGIIPMLDEDEEKNKKTIAVMLKRLQINNENIPGEDIVECFNYLIEDFRKSKYDSNLISFDWQINIIDRKKDKVNLNKAEKIEITTKFNTYNDKTQRYESNVIKINYSEFKEILNNFKNLDEQLHLFKQ